MKTLILISLILMSLPANADTYVIEEYKGSGRIYVCGQTEEQLRQRNYEESKEARDFKESARRFDKTIAIEKHRIDMKQGQTVIVK